MTDFAPLATVDDTSHAAAFDAEGLGDPTDVRAVARPISEHARHAARERAMAAYDDGHRDGYDKLPSTPAAYGYTADSDLEVYAGGYGDGCQLREDEHLEQIERTYPDGAYTIVGHRLA